MASYGSNIFYFFVYFSLSFAYEFKTKYITLPVDHFSFTTNATFKLRYLVNDSYYENDGPILFYTGNEGNVDMFAQNTGFMFDIAPQFNGLLVFAEHRYYGVSLPFGNDSFSSPEKLGYLTTQQALADFVDVIYELQETYAKGDFKLPVVTFGGSYGGMLSAWLRMKYPHIVIGAIASSAPIWQFKDLTPCQNFYRVVTDVYSTTGSRQCSDSIKRSWAIVRNETQTEAGKNNISERWKLCQTLKTQEDVDTLIEWLGNIYTDVAMVNYPYENNYLYPLPAYPVIQLCNRLTNGGHDDLLDAIEYAFQLYTNYTGTSKCNDISKQSTQLGESAWNFQACTEIIMPMCSTDDDMFENDPWDFKEYADECYKTTGVRPTSEVVPILEYGGRDIKASSNIVFSNGLLDPWSQGGVLSNVSSDVVAVVIPDAAHHLDLRAANQADPETVINARKFHVRQIQNWLYKFYAENNVVSPIFVEMV